MKSSLFVILFLAFMFAVALTFITQGHVFAQDADPIEIPGTAVEGLEMLAGLIVVFLVGLVSHWLTDVVNALPEWLPGEDKKALGDKLAGLVALVVPVLVGQLSTFLAPVAQFLDDQGYWRIILVAFPVLVSKVFFEARSYRRAIAAKN